MSDNNEYDPIYSPEATDGKPDWPARLVVGLFVVILIGIAIGALVALR